MKTKKIGEDTYVRIFESDDRNAIICLEMSLEHYEVECLKFFMEGDTKSIYTLYVKVK